MTVLALIWALIVLASLITWLYRRDLRKEMLWAGLLAMPILALPPIFFGGYGQALPLTVVLNDWPSVLWRLLVSFALGSLAASLYEALFHRHFVLRQQPSRHLFIWLLLGPMVFIILFAIFHFNVVISLLVGLLSDLILVIVTRRDLLWDALFSGAAMGLLYFIIYFVAFRTLNGQVGHLWFSNGLTGLTIVGLPIEEVIGVFLFGALWGPLYAAIKDLRISQ